MECLMSTMPIPSKKKKKIMKTLTLRVTQPAGFKWTQINFQRIHIQNVSYEFRKYGKTKHTFHINIHIHKSETQSAQSQ